MTRRIRFSALIAAISAAALLTHPDEAALAQTAASPQDFADCQQSADVARAIAGCTHIGRDPAQPSGDRARAWRLVGSYSMAKDALDAAIGAFREAIRLDPKNAAVDYASRAIAELRTGDRASATADYRSAVALDAAGIDAMVGASVDLQQIAADAKASPAQQGDASPITSLATCRTGEAGARIAACTGALNSGTLQGGALAEAFFNRADALTHQGKWRESLDDYDRALTLAPTVAHYYNDRGVAWRETKESDKAMRDFNQAVALDPNYALGYANRCNLLYVEQRYSEALDQCNIAIRKNSELGWAYSRRAAVHEALHNWKPMLDDGNRVIELDPKSEYGYRIRGHAYFEAKQYPEAIVDFSRAIELNPKASYSWRMRGRSHYFAGEIDAAIADLTAALRVDPGGTWATTWLNQAKRG